MGADRIFDNPGDPGTWCPADNTTRHIIKFRTDGSFTSSNGIYNGATKYQRTDSVRIKFLQPQTGTETKCYFSIEDNNQTLIISPIGCIEGCSNKYKAVENDDKGK